MTNNMAQQKMLMEIVHTEEEERKHGAWEAYILGQE